MAAEHEITALIRSLCELTGVGVCFYDTENFFITEKRERRNIPAITAIFAVLPVSCRGGVCTVTRATTVRRWNWRAPTERPFFTAVIWGFANWWYLFCAEGDCWAWFL